MPVARMSAATCGPTPQKSPDVAERRSQSSTRRALEIAAGSVLNSEMLNDPDLVRLIERIGPLDPAQFATLSDLERTQLHQLAEKLGCHVVAYARPQPLTIERHLCRSVRAAVLAGDELEELQRLEANTPYTLIAYVAPWSVTGRP